MKRSVIYLLFFVVFLPLFLLSCNNEDNIFELNKKVNELKKTIEDSELSEEQILNERNSIALDLYGISYEEIIKINWKKVAKDSGILFIESLFTYGAAPASTAKRTKESVELLNKKIEIDKILVEKIYKNGLK